MACWAYHPRPRAREGRPRSFLRLVRRARRSGNNVQDHVRVALARPSHGAELVGSPIVDPDQALAALAGLGLARHRVHLQRPGNRPKASALMAILIMPSPAQRESTGPQRCRPEVAVAVVPDGDAALIAHVGPTTRTWSSLAERLEWSKKA